MNEKKYKQRNIKLALLACHYSLHENILLPLSFRNYPETLLLLEMFQL